MFRYLATVLVVLAGLACAGGNGKPSPEPYTVLVVENRWNRWGVTGIDVRAYGSKRVLARGVGSIPQETRIYKRDLYNGALYLSVRPHGTREWIPAWRVVGGCAVYDVQIGDGRTWTFTINQSSEFSCDIVNWDTR